MHVAKLRFRNVGPFKGEHCLDLEAKPYAVVAEHESDPERSNWSGKTFLVDLLKLALYGEHRFRVDDDWISRGEAAGEVELTLSDGAVVKRSKVRGTGAVRLYFWPPGAGPNEAAVQAGAQEAIVRHVGLSLRDYLATSTVEQRQAARLICALPSEAMKVVGAWLELDKLQRCAAEVATRLSAAVKEHDKLAAERGLLERQRVELVGDWDRIEGGLDGKIAELELAVSALEAKRVEADVELQRLRSEDGLRVMVEDFKKLVEEGKALAARPPVPETQAGVEAAERRFLEHSTAAAADRAKLDSAKQASRGEFSGVCPVAGIACPATVEINASGEDLRRHLAVVRDEATASNLRLCELKKDLEDRHARLVALRNHDADLSRIRKQAIELRARIAGRVPTAGNPFAAAHTLVLAENAVDDARAELHGFRIRRDRIIGAHLSVAAVDVRIAASAADVTTLREAALVFGRSGAQRRVAEAALSSIEDGANDALRACGLDLSVRVRWSRETRDLASACDACGQPFPSSTKVRTCEGCGAPRGPKLAEELHFDLSDRSGAAEDVAGLAVQLAASAYLRAARGSSWEVCVLDEVFAHMDAPMRRAVATHAVAMLPRYGVRQAFVVAHAAHVLDAFPGRIRVRRGADGWSAASVVA